MPLDTSNKGNEITSKRLTDSQAGFGGSILQPLRDRISQVIVASRSRLYYPNALPNTEKPSYFFQELFDPFDQNPDLGDPQSSSTPALSSSGASGGSSTSLSGNSSSGTGSSSGFGLSSSGTGSSSIPPSSSGPASSISGGSLPGSSGSATTSSSVSSSSITYPTCLSCPGPTPPQQSCPDSVCPSILVDSFGTVHDLCPNTCVTTDACSCECPGSSASPTTRYRCCYDGYGTTQTGCSNQSTCVQAKLRCGGLFLCNCSYGDCCPVFVPA